MMTKEMAQEVLRDMRRDKMSLKVERPFLELALRIRSHAMTDGAQEVYRARIQELSK